MVPALIRERDPEARIGFFSHIPSPGPSYLLVLPGSMREAYLTGMLGADVVGFQAEVWADAFLHSCRWHLGAEVDFGDGTVRHRGREVRVRVYPISVDLAALRTAATARPVATAGRRVDRVRGDRTLVVRADRVEPSKNVIRGFQAYERFLERRPDHRGKVVFLALLTPSRQDVPEYAAYLRDCRAEARRVNRRWGRKDWKPITVIVRDDYAETLAAYQRYDVLLVNPVFDGMNLVAKEGPALNERDGTLILSENAGAHWELGIHAIGINPFDVEATAVAIERAVDLSAEERAARAAGLRAAVEGNPVDRWVSRQVEDLLA
jgi:trehalose 6-phosphate synthase